MAKVKDLLPWKLTDSLTRCCNEQIFRTCKGCGNWEAFDYHCSLKFCPLCNWRIARTREKMLALWTRQISQPKHVVLTQRNIGVLTRFAIRKMQKRYAKLRRKKIFKHVLGGCVSTEITNEGQGWHVHLHILCDARWIPANRLAIEWGKLVGQDFAIVKVKDCRQLDYLGEVCKYAVTTKQLASWDDQKIVQFVQAVQGIRMFATYGSLFKLGRQLKRQLEAEKPTSPPCECGCDDYTWSDERREAWQDATRR